jgi:hypothetical protein
MATTAQININVNASQADKTVQQLNKDLTAAGGSAASLRTELRQVTQELQGLEPSSKRFQELSQRAGELRDRIQDTSAVISATAGNVTENFGRALGNSLQIGVAGFQAIQGGAAAFGIESEDLQQKMVQLQGLLNLSQAIETFGGLGDKLVEIKAGFTPILQQLGLMATTQTEVAVATGAADAALVGEAVAAEGAAVSTGFFATALNALPLVAIVTALGLLVAGLISYSSASSDAEKKEKAAAKQKEELKKRTEEQKKAQEQERQSVVAASKDYVGLIYQIKNTTAGTKERKQAIDDVNKTYGTTLKNLSDEFAFQEQLNNSIRNYISLQVVKVRQEGNIEKIADLITKQSKAYGELAKAEAKRDQQAKDSNVTNKYVYDNFVDIRLAIDKAQRSVNQYQFQIDALTLSSEELAKEEIRLGKTFNGNNKPLKDNTDASNKNAEALERQKEALSNLRSLYDREISAQKELEALRQAQTQITLDGLQMVDDGYGNLIQKQNDFIQYTGKYFVDIYNIEQQYRDKQSSLIDAATEREIQKYEESILGKKVSETEYYNARKKIAENGIKNLSETELALLGVTKDLNDKEVQEYINAWNLKENIAQESTILTQAEIEKLTFDFNQKMMVEEIENSTKTEEEKKNAIIKIKTDSFEQEKLLIQKIGDEQVKILKKQRDLELNNLDLTENEKLQITKKYDKQILESEQNTQSQIQDAINETIQVQETQLEKLEGTLTKVDNYLEVIQQAFSEFETTFTMFQEQQAEIRTQAIEDGFNKQQALLESSLAEGLISEEQYRNSITQLEQQQQQDETALRYKSFRQNKALSIASATIDGARAVLSTFANTPGELIIKSIAAALAGVFAATQIALIGRQEFRAAVGGIVPGTGSGEIDSVPSRLAPGEAVINSKSTSAFLPLLSMINEASGGKSLMPDLPAVNEGQRFQPVFQSQTQTQPIRAYVVESDISQSQRRVNRIINSATF